MLRPAGKVLLICGSRFLIPEMIARVEVAPFLMTLIVVVVVLDNFVSLKTRTSCTRPLGWPE